MALWEIIFIILGVGVILSPVVIVTVIFIVAAIYSYFDDK